jgi:2-oxoglutarate ferredoxin oxidoreductase subunit beta
MVEADFVPAVAEIAAELAAGAATSVTMHDGSVVRFRKVATDYDPTDRTAVWSYLQARQSTGEIPVGLLFLDEKGIEMHQGAKTVDTPLTRIAFEELCPGAAVLQKIQEAYR